MPQTLILFIGYAASVLLALSLLESNYIKFRILNTSCNVVFIIYGILIHAWPIIVTNTVVLFINFYHLYKVFNKTEDFDLIEFAGNEKLVHKFLHFYEKDIKKYFPTYCHETTAGYLRFVVLRDLVIANIFVAELAENGDAFVKINYTVSRYRDYKVGKFIFVKENKFLLSKGVKRLIYKDAFGKAHEQFLHKMGFKPEQIGEQKLYVKHLI